MTDAKQLASERMLSEPCPGCGHRGSHTCGPFNWAVQQSNLLKQILEVLKSIDKHMEANDDGYV